MILTLKSGKFLAQKLNILTSRILAQELKLSLEVLVLMLVLKSDRELLEAMKRNGAQK